MTGRVVFNAPETGLCLVTLGSSQHSPDSQFKKGAYGRRTGHVGKGQKRREERMEREAGEKY